MSQLEVKGVSYRFPNGTIALQDISFMIDKGEFVVISGKNGSGKTVLLRVLNGLIKPTTGYISIKGVSVTDNPYEARRQLGLVFQQADSQIVGQTVSKDIAFGLENIGLSKDEVTLRVAQTLEITDLSKHAHQRPRTLSGGEKRRLTIAGVVAMAPNIIALDEPFTNLDYPGVLQVLKQLIQLKEMGHTIIVVTHDLEKVLAHASRLILMDNGSIVANGTPLEALPVAKDCGVRMTHEPTSDRIREMTWLRN